MDDQPDAETATRQYTTLTSDKLPCPDAIRSLNPSKFVTADPPLKLRGNWNWLWNSIIIDN